MSLIREWERLANLLERQKSLSPDSEWETMAKARGLVSGAWANLAREVTTS